MDGAAVARSFFRGSNVRIIENPLENALLNACRRADVDFLRKFIQENRTEAAFAIADTYGLGPVHYAASSRSYECVKILLETKLVDIQFKSGHPRAWTCFDVAIHRQSWDIARLLLNHDPNFDLVRKINDRLPRYAKFIESLLDLLEEMSFPFSNDFHLLALLARALTFESDDAKTRSMTIFSKLIGLVVDEAENNFMQGIFVALQQNRAKDNKHLFMWCIERWYLSERNKHRDLVQKLIDNLDAGFDIYTILCLHSDIDSTTVPGYATFYTRQIFESILNGLLQSSVDREVVNGVIVALWPKVDWRSFSAFFREKLYGVNFRVAPDAAAKMISIEWLDMMQLGDKLNLDSMVCTNTSQLKTFLKALMPFSTKAIAADEYLERLREYLIKSKANSDRQRPTPEVWWYGNYLELVEDLRRLDEDDELGKYCAEGAYRARSTLKCLCRTEIRKCLLRSRTIPHSQLVENIQSLELPESFHKYSKRRNLPKSIQRFLMFIYSDYDFDVHTKKRQTDEESLGSKKLKQ